MAARQLAQAEEGSEVSDVSGEDAPEASDNDEQSDMEEEAEEEGSDEETPAGAGTWETDEELPQSQECVLEDEEMRSGSSSDESADEADGEPSEDESKALSVAVEEQPGEQCRNSSLDCKLACSFQVPCEIASAFKVLHTRRNGRLLIVPSRIARSSPSL